MHLAWCLPCRDRIAEESYIATLKMSMAGLTYWRNTYGDNAVFSIHHHARAHVHIARWHILHDAYNSGADWFIWLDDDAAPPPDTLELLHRHDKEAVAPLFTTREIPARWPCTNLSMQDETLPDGTKSKRVVGTDLFEVPKELTRIGVTGLHCVLMKRSAIQKVLEATSGQSPFQYRAVGRTTTRAIGEDIAFFQYLWLAGGELWVDPSFEVGHIGTYNYGMKDRPQS